MAMGLIRYGKVSRSRTAMTLFAAFGWKIFGTYAIRGLTKPLLDMEHLHGIERLVYFETMEDIMRPDIGYLI